MGRNAELPPELARFRVSRQAGQAGDVGAGEGPDDTGCHVLHIDMDAFFAAVELRTRPELADRPVIVAGDGPRSVVLSANYPARRYGVHSAMPVAGAYRRCPRLTLLTPTPGAYREISRGVMDIFRAVTPQVEPLSLDEAFLDVGGALRRLDRTPAGIAADVREEVAAAYGITCSVGIAPVKFLAKLASSMAKPDGMLAVPAARALEFLHPLPASALHGVGGRTTASLERLGVHTIGDVAHTPLPRLRRAIGAAAAGHVHALAWARDPRPVVADAPEKSLGAEHTFDTDRDSRAEHTRELLRLADRVSSSLRGKRLRARTVAIKVRFADFTTITRSRSVPVPTDVTREIYRCARDLLGECVPPRALVRLLGVRAEGLVDARSGEQLSFAPDGSRWRDAEVAVDDARHRFGAAAVRPASLLPPSGGEDRR
ncbi:DNA polymerase IV [Haloechinothrix sp. LS1_15]|uniref:DNA polymerase IV n=1 Tax=Haloechinothrix sp. LS1_15 TaxID=2652248 RepID=UPI002946EA90|nr:DNA polymerase IV [Haloechinothrix sp. LS1_15]MDV6012170.1 DNA polymerase IV [Haloechinothrix sp. LS1_15]